MTKIEEQPFTIFPAIDLRANQVVRLEMGDPKRQTVFDSDPEAVARRWIDAGATWLHVVNLSGALDEAGGANWRVLSYLVEMGARIQFGGGIRTMRDIEHALQLGVERVVLGTVAIEDPPIVRRAVENFGAARIMVALDAESGMIKTRGWQAATGVRAVVLGREMRQMGIERAIHTDISRDGVLTGVNWRASRAIAEETELDIIASGGVSSIEDIEMCARAEGVVGVIVGRALYDGRIELAQAIERVRSITQP